MHFRSALAAIVLAFASPSLAADPGCPEGMRRIEGGRYTIGDGSASGVVGPYCLDAREVTAAQYGACVRSGRCGAEEMACSRAATWGDPARADFPINCVSWFEADAYCTAAGKRLPSELEWEWAARGGARASVFPWGAGPPARQACWDGKGNALGRGGRKEPCAVGAHPEGDSPDGVSDLAGNVREWTSSSEGRFRVVRGGSWGDSLPDFLAAAFRGMNAPDERFELTGFRCAAAAPGGGPPPASAAAPSRALPSPPAPPPAAPPVPVHRVDELRIVFKAGK